HAHGHGDGGHDEVNDEERQHDQEADLEAAPYFRDHEGRHQDAQVDRLGRDLLAALARKVGEQIKVLVAHIAQHETAEGLGNLLQRLDLANLIVHERPYAIVPRLVESRRHDIEGHE